MKGQVDYLRLDLRVAEPVCDLVATDRLLKAPDGCKAGAAVEVAVDVERWPGCQIQRFLYPKLIYQFRTWPRRSLWSNQNFEGKEGRADGQQGPDGVGQAKTVTAARPIA